MKIAIIGLTGFLGYSLTKSFIKLEYQVSLFGRRNHENFLNSQFFELNISNEQNFEKLLTFDIVINTIGAGVQSGAKIQPHEVYETNLNFPIKLACYLEQNTFNGKLITFGSYFEIGNEINRKIYTETELLDSQNKLANGYCVSKKLLSNYINFSNNSFSHLHVFLPSIYGELESSNRLIPYIINSINLNIKPSLSNGNQVRQYLYIEDLINGLIDIIEKPKNEIIGFLNFPSFETIRIKDMVELIYNYFNQKIDESIFGTIETRDVEMRSLALNFNKYINLNLTKPQFSITSNLNKYTNVSKF
jgi:nucleoside-diphosphate-sugar epimerase